MCEEIWKEIPEFRGFYSVSNHGRVKRHTTLVKCARGYRTIKEHIQKMGKDKNGYHLVGLCVLGKMYTRKVHRLVGEAFVINPENKPQINHINGIKSDNAHTNLEWTTGSENIIHAFLTGLKSGESKRGEKHHNAKLTREQVDSIRFEYAHSTISYRKLGRKYNMSRMAIKYIIQNKSWKT